MGRFLLVLLLAALAPPAFASSGDNCSSADAAFYGATDPTIYCLLLCDGISNGGAQTECKPATPINVAANIPVDTCVVSISKAQTGCVTGNIYIEEASSSASATPVVWSRITTLTGILSPLVSESDFPRRPRRYLRATLDAAVGASCTDVDVTIECQNLQQP